MKRFQIGPAVAGALLVAVAGAKAADAPQAKAVIEPRSGSTVTGYATFTEMPDGSVKVIVDIAKAPPGTHGLHVHEKGDCSDPEAKSAGGHFNPTGQAHGDPHTATHHAGDIPMLEADAQGNARLEARLDGLTIGSGPNDIVGRAVVIHANPDDYRSQPAGNSGPRVACGVIVAR